MEHLKEAGQDLSIELVEAAIPKTKAALWSVIDPNDKIDLPGASTIEPKDNPSLGGSDVHKEVRIEPFSDMHVMDLCMRQAKELTEKHKYPLENMSQIAISMFIRRAK
jgi:hypothetical protein